MELTRVELVSLLGMVENIGERLEEAGILEHCFDKLIQLDGALSDSHDNDRYSRKKYENELLLKIVKSIVEEC